MQHHRVLIWAGLALAANWLSVAWLDLDDPSWAIARVGYFLGSLSAHATLAAAWSVFGPGRLRLRVPLSIIWAALLPAALAVNIAIRDGHEDIYPLGACLLGQWLLLQILFAGVARGFSLRLGHTAEVEGANGQRFRFGIRDLLILMTICSVVLTLGRLIVPRISVSSGGELSIFIFLAAAAIVMTFPLLLAALLRSNSFVGVLLSLLLIAVATGLELPILKTLEGSSGGTTGHFIAINLTSAVLILVIAGIIRLGGYRLFARHVVEEL